jgi:hypothetical protein
LSITLHENQVSAQLPPSHTKSKLLNLHELNLSSKSKTVIVYPIFTQAAYGNKGFYDYYRNQCDSSCLTVNIPLKPIGGYVSSGMGFLFLSSRNFDNVTDVDVDKNPEILKQYQRVIVLHNEYVTKKEFVAITSHPNVLYLYPNALYAEIKVNYNTNQITLVRGHGYPTPSLGNGFGWKFDNSRFEYDTNCKNWSFYKITNGMMLNCYPELRVAYDKSLLSSIVE